MGKQCVQCGKSCVEENDGQYVCTACGVVASEFIAEQNVFEVGTSFISSAPSNIPGVARQMLASGGLPDEHILKHGVTAPRWKVVGSNKITQLCSVLSLGSDVKQLAVRYYDDLCVNLERSIKHRTVPQKEVFCCACVYMACREYELPVTMGYIAGASEYSADHCFGAVKEATSILNMHLKPQSTDSLIEAVLTRDIHTTVKPTENAKSLTKQVIELMADLFLSQGRKPNALIAAVFFYVYKSEDFCKRRKLPLSKVVKNSKAVAKTKSVIQPALFELLKSIPWVSESDHTEEMIPYYLKDIVRFKKVLIREALSRTCEEPENQEKECGDKRTPKEEETQNIPPTNEISETFDPIVISPLREESQVSTVNTLNDEDSTTASNKRRHITGTSNEVDLVNGNPNSESPQLKDQTSQKSGLAHDGNNAEGQTTNTLFYPPAYKRARRRSEEREEIRAYIENGKAALDKLAKKYE